MHKIITRAAAGLLVAALLTGAVLADTPPGGTASYAGIDVYHGNGSIDWATVAQSKSWAYIKASEGENYIDPMFAANRTGAAAAGMKWGPYHFLRLYSAESAKTQADHFWARIKNTGFSVTPAVDVETHDGQQSAVVMRAIVRAFVDEFKAVSGITPVLYTYTSYANDILKDQFTDCPLWLADYRGYAGTVSWPSYAAWQYSEKGSVVGTTGNTDLDTATSAIFIGADTPVTGSKPSTSSGGSTTSASGSGVYTLASRSSTANSTAGADFNVYDADGVLQSGRQVCKGDRLTILSVDYGRQLAEVEYPAGNGFVHAYIHNREDLLHNTGYNAWRNGSTNEPVYNKAGARIGTVYPHEYATVLSHDSDGRTHILYGTSKGTETKDGYVRYKGAT